MPHPEHAVDPLTGSADGGKLFESLVAHAGALVARMSAGTADARHRELGLTDAEYDAIVERLGREPNDLELAVFSLMWSEHCAYKHSKKLLRRLPTEGPRVVMGPGENAGAVDVGERAGGGVQGRVAQPPERGRAVPGGRDRGRRHPARRVRGRRAADRDPRLAALRRARLRALALPARARRGRHRPLRQLDRRGHRRRRDLLRGALRAELPGERDVRGDRAAGAADPERRGGGGQPRSCCSARSPAATASAGPRCWPAPSSTPRTSRSGRASRSATRSRSRSCSSAASSCSTPGCSRRSRTWARRGSPRARRRWRRRARSGSTSTCRACRCARPAWSRSR